jgi:hypothetical protein
MKRSLIAAALLLSLTAPSHAFFTECTAKQETTLLNRPGGDTEPRWSPIAKGDTAAIRDTYRDWVFVVHYIGEHAEYGWVPHGALVNCQPKDGTP